MRRNSTASMSNSPISVSTRSRFRSHPPIWVGGESGPALRRAARIGDAWYPIGTNPQNPLDSLARFKAQAARLDGPRGRPRSSGRAQLARHVVRRDRAGTGRVMANIACSPVRRRWSPPTSGRCATRCRQPRFRFWWFDSRRSSHRHAEIQGRGVAAGLDFQLPSWRISVAQRSSCGRMVSALPRSGSTRRGTPRRRGRA